MTQSTLPTAGWQRVPSPSARCRPTPMAPVAPWRRGWGVRTLDDRVARYNPMSHHNGSVWPHDNASAVPLFRLPELF